MKYDLEERLSEFSVRAGDIENYSLTNAFSNNLYQQLIRSCTSVTLNFAESRSAESVKDFVHKLSICLKELRETKRNLQMLVSSYSLKDKNVENFLLNENEELIAILAKSIITTKKNNPKVFR